RCKVLGANSLHWRPPNGPQCIHSRLLLTLQHVTVTVTNYILTLSGTAVGRRLLAGRSGAHLLVEPPRVVGASASHSPLLDVRRRGGAFARGRGGAFARGRGGAWSGSRVGGSGFDGVVGFATPPGGPVAAAHRPITASHEIPARGESPVSIPRAGSPSGPWSRG